MPKRLPKKTTTSKKTSKKATKAVAAEILRLAKLVLQRSGYPWGPYGRRFDSKHLYIRSDTLTVPFKTTYLVMTFSLRENKVVVRATENEVVEAGGEPWATKALHELRKLLVLEVMAEI